MAACKSFGMAHLLVKGVQGSHSSLDGRFSFREVGFGVSLLDAHLTYRTGVHRGWFTIFSKVHMNRKDTSGEATIRMATPRHGMRSRRILY